MSMVLSFILWLLIGFFTGYIANQRGRDPYLWFGVGMLLGLFGLLLLMLLPTVSEEAKKAPSEEAAQKSTIVITPMVTSSKGEKEYLIKDWFCLDAAHQQQGPMRFDALKSLWKMGKINLHSFVWCEGMETWDRVEKLQDLKQALDQ